MCGSPDHLVWDCLKVISRFAWKAYLNTHGGMKQREAEALRSQLPLCKFPQMTHPEHRNIVKDSLLEPRPTYLLVWTQKYSLSQDRWWEQLGSLGQWFYNQCSDPRVCQGSLLVNWSIEWPGWWYFMCEWLWQVLLLTLGISYQKGSSGMGMGLWPSSSGPAHSRSNWLWILGASYFGGTDHQ